ncbi:MAG: hypothetical protein P4L28_12170 [Paludibacteraceae bacterium]|nr:hypothetical protein [Paludibacteraceae bacterium]
MNLILNIPILGLNGRALRFQTAQIAHTPSHLEQPVTATLSFGQVLLRTLTQKATDTDADALAILTLCESINSNLQAAEGTPLVVTDTDYSIIVAVMAKQPAIIKARFLQMVAANNASQS